MALAQIKEIENLDLSESSAELANFCSANCNEDFKIRNFQFAVRGLGFDGGRRTATCPTAGRANDVAMQAIKTMLQRGFILLPEGDMVTSSVSPTA